MKSIKMSSCDRGIGAALLYKTIIYIIGNLTRCTGFSGLRHDDFGRERPPLTRCPDCDAFWQQTLAEQGPVNGSLEPVDYPVPEVNSSPAHYDGWQGAPISAWYLRPHGSGPFPAIVFYHPYLGTKGDICHYLPWVWQDDAVLAVDVGDGGCEA